MSHLSIFFITEFATGGEDRAVGGGIGDMEENQLLRVVSERGETEERWGGRVRGERDRRDRGECERGG